MEMRISPDGQVRVIHDDDYATVFNAVPQRASHVEPIPTGLNAGLWYVDMSPLGDTFNYCLWPPYQRRDEALAAEHDFISLHWIHSG